MIYHRLWSWLAVAAVALGVGTLAGCNSSSSANSPAVAGGEAKPAVAAKKVELLNASYDPTRELWRDLNAAFIASYQKSDNVAVDIAQSHGGSGSQARAVADGLEADVVTLALWSDTDAIRKTGLISSGWEERLPNHSSPYYSTIVFVVRKGNPKQIKDWTDLTRDGVQVITPSPKTSGNGKLSFLAAWGSVTSRGGSEEDSLKLVRQLYEHTPVLDSAARGATVTFAQKKIGDVHLTWENEAYLEIKESKGELEIVYPPVSVRAEPSVAVVDKNVDKKGTRAAAEAYLKFTYTDEGQEIIAKNFYRPISESVASRHAADFPTIKLFPINSLGGSWDEINKKFFAEGAAFDQIYAKK
ncbi:MAG: sulfate ABC transporter substrate-binding protein [Planctomycetes bacterium]|nr:sulfate ABC transporter substrate-binding protein [Planctomycetota bacterium]